MANGAFSGDRGFSVRRFLFRRGAKKGRSQPHRRLHVESLESRCLLSGWTAISAGQGGTSPNDEGRAVVLDAEGNSYVAGSYFYADGAADLTASAGGDILVAKYGPDGTPQWRHVIGSAGDGRAEGIARDSAGNIYVTGAFSGTVDFSPGSGTGTLTAAGGLDAFVLKLDRNGLFQWAKRIGGSSSVADIGYGVAIDSAGSVLITGQFGGKVDFDPSAGTMNLTSAGSADVFVLKLTGAGGFVWAARMGGSGVDRGTAVTADSLNRVYTTGSFRGTADFNPSSSATANLASAGAADVFVSRLDSAGKYSLAKALGGSSTDEGHDIEVDSSGNIYTTGYFNGTADFDPGSGARRLTSAGGADVFVSKLTANGAYSFARRIGGSGDDRGRGLLLDGGGVAVTGHFVGTVDFDPGAGTANLAGAGSTDVFLARLTSTGSYVSARRIGGTGMDMGRGIARDAAGSLYVTGFFSGTVNFDTTGGDFRLTSSGGKDLFLARVPSQVNHAPVLAPIGSRSVNEGSLLGFTVSAIDADGDALSYSAGGLPAGATFNATARTFAWTPAAGQEGVYQVTFTVSDGKLTDSEIVTLTCTAQGWEFGTAMAFAEQQLLDTIREVSDPTRYPCSTSSAGSWTTKSASSWTSGFYPGQLWMMDEATGNAVFRTAAERWLTGLAGQASHTDTHDLGFMIFDSFGQAYRITGNAAYKQTILTAAASLATRFDPDVGAIRSWNTEPFNVIVDSMMNMELLFWASKHGPDPVQNQRWYDMALSHADVVAANHVRTDGSTRQIVYFDPVTGQRTGFGKKQGYSVDSTWSRGQGWAVYGFTMAYRETGQQRFLDTARRAADYFIAHLPADHVPYWDFQAPNIPNEPRDSSAAAVAASGLLELRALVGTPSDRDRYFAAARAILQSLTSSAYLSDGIRSSGILLHGTGNKPNGTEVDGSLIYGDYYFIEALTRYRAIASPRPQGPGDRMWSGVVSASAGERDGEDSRTPGRYEAWVSLVEVTR